MGTVGDSNVLSVYCGLMGSGKTYEVVANVIVPALKADPPRRILHNIDGLNVKALSEYVGRDCTDLVREFEHEKILEVTSWPQKHQIDANDYSQSIVAGGDLIIIDEAARYFPATEKVPKQILEFFRMARHAVDAETKYTTNVVLLIQDYFMMHRAVRGLVSGVTQMRKLGSVGMPNRYRVSVFDGNRPTRAMFIGQWQKKYDPKIFPLYKSHSTEGAKEVRTDERGVIWKHPKVIAFAVSIVALIGVAFWAGSSAWASFSGSDDEASLTSPGAASNGDPSQADAAFDQYVRQKSPVAELPTRSVLGLVRPEQGPPFLILDGPDGTIILNSLSGFTVSGNNVRGEYLGVAYSSSVSPSASARSSSGGGLFGAALSSR